jgi:hypothetical protein
VPAGGREQIGAVLAAILGIDVGAGRDEKLGCFDAVGTGGDQERGSPVRVPRLHVRSRGEKTCDRGSLAGRGRFEQRPVEIGHG